MTNTVDGRSRIKTETLLASTVGTVGIHHVRLPDWSETSDQFRVERQAQPRSGVSLQEAEQSLSRVLGQFGYSDHPRLGTLEKMPMSDMLMAVTNLSLKVFSDTATAVSKAQQLMTETQEALRDKKIKEYQQQIDKAVEQSDKARKGGIFGAVFDWIIGAAEVAYGAFEVAMGNEVSGVAYLSAGVAGMVKAAAETAALCGADPKECQEVADIAGKIQLGCEVVGMALDILQAGRAISATRGIAKGTESVMEEVAPKLVESIAAGAEKEVGTLAEQIGIQVTEQVSEQVVANLSKVLGEATEGLAIDTAEEAIEGVAISAEEAVAEEVAVQGEKTTRRLLQAFSKEGIQELVTSAMKRVGKQAIEKGTEVTAEAITQQVVSAVKWSVYRTIAKACTLTTLNAVKAIAVAGKSITVGSIDIEKAKLQKQMQELIQQQDFLEFSYEWFEKAKQQRISAMKDLIDKQDTALEGASSTITQMGMLQARIAGSIV